MKSVFEYERDDIAAAKAAQEALEREEQREKERLAYHGQPTPLPPTHMERELANIKLEDVLDIDRLRKIVSVGQKLLDFQGSADAFLSQVTGFKELCRSFGTMSAWTPDVIRRVKRDLHQHGPGYLSVRHNGHMRRINAIAKKSLVLDMSGGGEALVALHRCNPDTLAPTEARDRPNKEVAQ